ncbi:hypothetical protein LUZ60_008705 [Juncus effusus]|nr:hypothetical protein LUZ60_008705 [Juncus effusus]
MAGKGQPLPKFGEWDVNDPASADGYTVIFNKARDERNSSSSTAQVGTDLRQNEDHLSKNTPNSGKTDCKKWFCCFGGSSTKS